MMARPRPFYGRQGLQLGRVQVQPCHRNSVTTAVSGHTAHTSAIKVSFALPYRCNFGQSLSIVGSAHLLGSWNVQRGLQMQWTSGDVWTVEMELQTRRHRSGVQGQELLERIQVQDAWDGPSSIDITWSPLHAEEFNSDTSFMRILTSKADAALSELDTAIKESLCLLHHLQDPMHPDALKADQRIAAAAHVAMEASQALQAAEACPASTLAATAKSPKET
ncbi:hypothetical protein WJX74_002967 [Apatococcus lobatus]|uniref:CBM20 domain-containing protein n=1 Tax=Apatococcus lobatus TaxID=904363 RepID=A0AAW1S261_9CHLO